MVKRSDGFTSPLKHEDFDDCEMSKIEREMKKEKDDFIDKLIEAQTVSKPKRKPLVDQTKWDCGCLVERTEDEDLYLSPCTEHFLLFEKIKDRQFDTMLSDKEVDELRLAWMIHVWNRGAIMKTTELPDGE